MISVKHLELLALREIRSCPGGQCVTHVEVKRSNMDWTLVATVSAGADPDCIQHAVTTTTNRLKQRYSVQFDW
jgi:hypothetical protein